MGKSRNDRRQERPQRPKKDDDPGSNEQVEAAPPDGAAAQPSRNSEFRMILDESVATVLDGPSPVFTHDRRDAAQITTTIAANDDHPLAGLSPQRRTQDRIDVIASILARLAIKALEIPANAQGINVASLAIAGNGGPGDPRVGYVGEPDIESILPERLAAVGIYAHDAFAFTIRLLVRSSQHVQFASHYDRRAPRSQIAAFPQHVAPRAAFGIEVINQTRFHRGAVVVRAAPKGPVQRIDLCR